MYSSPPLTPQTRKIPQAGEDGIEMGGICKIIDGGAPGRRAFGSVSQAKQESQGALQHLRPEGGCSISPGCDMAVQGVQVDRAGPTSVLQRCSCLSMAHGMKRTWHQDVEGD